SQLRPRQIRCHRRVGSNDAEVYEATLSDGRGAWGLGPGAWGLGLGAWAERRTRPGARLSDEFSSSSFLFLFSSSVPSPKPRAPAPPEPQALRMALANHLLNHIRQPAPAAVGHDCAHGEVVLAGG